MIYIAAIIIGQITRRMTKYKIQREFILSNKSYEQILQFLNNYQQIDLSLVRDNKGNTGLHQAAYNPAKFNVLKVELAYMEKYYSSRKELPNPEAKFRQFIDCENEDGLTPLHFACFRGHYKAIEELTEKKADAKKLTKSGQNVLHLAAQGGTLEAFIFFQSQVDINSRDHKNTTPLHWAAYNNNESIVTYLLAQPGIQLDLQDENGHTPLHLATSKGHLQIVKKLLKAGANRQMVNKNNMTALLIAQENEFRNIERVLRGEEGFLDCFKVYLNLKPTYQPQARSVKKPIMFFLLLCLNMCIRYFLLQQKDTSSLGPILYTEASLFVLVLVLYFSLMPAPPKRPPQTYISFIRNQVPLQRVCLTCAAEKPSRSLHCDVCKTCTEQYDHHCYWINNCVGKRNLSKFIAFIVVFQVYLWFVGFEAVFVLYNQFMKQKQVVYAGDRLTVPVVIWEALLGLFCLLFTFPLLFLIVVHIKNLLLNKTTYERYTKQKISTLTESSSHLIQSELLRNQRKQYSITNALAMCRSADPAQAENINSSLKQ